MGKPYFFTVEKTSTAMDSGEGLAVLGTLHLPLSPAHSEQREQLSMKSRNAFSNPERNTSLSSLDSFRLTPLDQACRSSGFLTFLGKWRMAASEYSLKNLSHSATDGVFGGQVALWPYSPHPKAHFILTHCETTMSF